MKCSMCTNPKDLKSSSVIHKYKECGLDNVILHGVARYHCDKCGEEYFGFHNLEKLHGLIALHLVLKGGLLTGKEIRFLRKHLGYAGNVFAKLVGYEIEHLSRIENGKTPLTSTFDRLVRMLVLEKFPDRHYKLQDLFLEDKFMRLDWLEFRLSGKNWILKKMA